MRNIRDISDVIKLHDSIVETFGGLPGIRDQELLAAALERAFMGMADGTEFFPTIETKAGVLLQSIIQFHPFVDGNKRTGVAITYIYLWESGYNWIFTQTQIVEFAIAIAATKLTLEEIASWIKQRIWLLG